MTASTLPGRSRSLPRRGHGPLRHQADRPGPPVPDRRRAGRGIRARVDAAATGRAGNRLIAPPTSPPGGLSPPSAPSCRWSRPARRRSRPAPSGAKVISAVSQRWRGLFVGALADGDGDRERLARLVEQPGGARLHVGADGELEPRALGPAELETTRPAARGFPVDGPAPEHHRLADRLAATSTVSTPPRPSAAGIRPRESRPDLERSGIDRARQRHREGERPAAPGASVTRAVAELLPAFTSRSTVPPFVQGSAPETACSSPAIHTVETAREPAAGTGTAFKLRRESGRIRASDRDRAGHVREPVRHRRRRRRLCRRHLRGASRTGSPSARARRRPGASRGP